MGSIHASKEEGKTWTFVGGEGVVPTNAFAFACLML